MKKIMKALLALVIVCVCFVAGCGVAGLQNNPAIEATVIGNGGMAMIKGDYLYFVNGYQDYKEYTDVNTDNKFGTVARSGIYRTKLVNGEVVRDENGFLVEAECVVPQTVGYQYGSFVIVGNYIYYLTPHMENAWVDGEKVLKNAWVDVCRINIDGTGMTKLYNTTNDSSSALNWSVYRMDGKTYIVLVDGTSLVSIDGDTGSSVVMAENVASVKLLKQSKYVYGCNDLKDSEKYVYYTREYNEDDRENGGKGNMLCRVEIGKSEENIVVCDNTNNYELIAYANGCVYYTKVNDESSNNWIKTVYRRNVSTNIEEFVCGNYSNLLIIDNNDPNSIDNYAIGVDSNKYMYLLVNGEQKHIYTASADVKLIGVDNGRVYFVENSAIYSLDYVADSAEPKQISNADKSYMLDDVNLVDMDGRRIYVYASYESESGDKHYYLNIIDSQNPDAECEFVGVFAEGETPAEPEETEDEEGNTIKDMWIK